MHTRAQQDEEKELNELSTGQLLFRTLRTCTLTIAGHSFAVTQDGGWELW